MTWPVIPLGSLLTLQRGYDLPEQSRRPGDIPVITSSGITGFHAEAGATGPGVVTGRYGTIGAVHFIEEDYWPHNTTLFVSDFKGNNPRFVAYLLKSLNLAHQVSSGAVPGVNRNILHAMLVPDVPHDRQRSIADTLSSYDDLIENNTRRIGLLEQAARLLYEEWFVRLRFPGHEHTRIVAGMPKGWERATLGDRVVLKYGKALKADDRRDGDYPVYGSSGVVGTHEKPLVDGPGIIVGRKGNVGAVYWSTRSYYPIDTVFFIDSDASTLYLYYALKRMHFISTDVAVPGLNRDFAYSRPLLVPPANLMRAFLDTVGVFHEQLEKLGEINEKLRSARDLLLPRLMSGEIEV